MKLLVLGSGAGGGSPQWNCACAVCRAVRSGEAPRRTQTSVAVSADGERWVLLNGSPDLGEQIVANRELHPRGEGRGSPIQAVVLTGAEIDQVTGLLHLREGHRFQIYGSGATLGALRQSRVFDVLPEERVPRRAVEPGEVVELVDGQGEALGLSVELLVVPGKVPLYEERSGEVPNLMDTSGTTVAVRVASAEGVCLFVPGCAVVTDALRQEIEGAEVLFFEGTLYRDDELIRAGLSEKTGRRMGHVSMSGPEGSMAALEEVNVGRRIYLHMNNSNPVLLPGSKERAEVEGAGWEVAYDGMKVGL